MKQNFKLTKDQQTLVEKKPVHRSLGHCQQHSCKSRHLWSGIRRSVPGRVPVALQGAFTYHAGQAQFSTYAKKVVKNGLLSYCRKICSQGRHISRLSIGDQGELAADGEQLEQPDDHFDSHLSRLETLDLLEASKQNYQGVARLGIEALALKVQGMRITDIAALYQVPPSHVGAWISRSLEKLRNDPDFLTCLL